MLSCSLDLKRTVIMKNHSTQQGSNRACTRVLYASRQQRLSGRVLIQALLLGTESFDPRRYRLIHLNTQIARPSEWPLQLSYHELRQKYRVLTQSPIDCSFQGLLAVQSEYKIEIRQDPIQHVSAQRFRANVGLIVASFHLPDSQLAIRQSW